MANEILASLHAGYVVRLRFFCVVAWRLKTRILCPVCDSCSASFLVPVPDRIDPAKATRRYPAFLESGFHLYPNGARSPKPDKQMMQLVLELLRPYRGWLLIVFIAMLVEIAMSLAAPWPLKLVLDDALGQPQAA